MGILNAIFDALNDIVGGFGQVLSSIFTSISEIFVTPATTTDGTATLSFIGILLLISVGSSLLFWGFNFVKNLISKSPKK